MSSDPPKRNSSLEMTAVRPRPELAPISMVPGPTIEQLADCERARRDAQDSIETLVECEGPCRRCPCCHGERMISPTRAEEWRRQQALVDVADDFDPPPTEAA